MSAPKGKKGGATPRPAASAPYRGGPSAEATAPGEEDGLVADLIRQFADPLAFYRELVQNSIDAGATSIVVQLLHEPGRDGEPGTMRASVRDDGSGMSRGTLEEDLTVLFRSSKENRDDAIGKFGIGFVSVLAVAPEVVIVDTSRGDGERWALHLHPDQTYDLYRESGGTERGTTVSLHVPMPDAERASFVERSEAALRRWCRHTRVPIRFVAVEIGRDEPLREARIDSPIGLDGALVAVHARSRDGHTIVVAGLPAAGGRVGAFYNQGLLLHETRDHELGEVAFKVMDSRLEHTLSRDDVRRDAHYDRAVELVASTIRGPLLDAVADALAQAADAHSRGSAEAGARMLALLDALALAELALPSGARVVPIVAAEGQRATTDLGSLSGAVFSRDGRTPLAEAIARGGRPVIDLSFATTDVARDRALAWIRAATEEQPPEDRAVLTRIVPVAVDDGDRALLARVTEILSEVARKPSDLVIATVDGRAGEHLAIAGPSRGDPWLLDPRGISEDPFRLLARPPIVLRADHPIVAKARERAARAPRLAAALLARAILVALDALTPARDEALTERALWRIVRGARA